MVIAMESK